jgi:hypothetical protein
MLIIASSWGSLVICPHQATLSSTVAGEKEDFCKGSLARTSFTFLFVFLYFILLALCYQKHKKLVSFIVAFIYLLLVLLE